LATSGLAVADILAPFLNFCQKKARNSEELMGTLRFAHPTSADH